MMRSHSKDISGRPCKFCEEPLPRAALHFSNRIAIENGYCCWLCMRPHLGDERAYKLLANGPKKG